jgi:uncharacterized membrane protein
MTAVPPADAPPQRKPARVGRVLDLAAASGLAVLAALLSGSLPGGSLLRAAVTLPILLVVPGYLLVEASVGSSRPGQRGLHALIGLGVSPPLVGLLALLTVLLPSGFSASAIVATVTVACLALAGVAMWRRLRVPKPQPPSAAAVEA